ncbi:MAG: signal peptidase I [Actinophytocola sp.]|uniref:signal peptidase I n=1 Tax=Actinophytocola sp. TaxID=1872138 RepID=UPI003D6B233F
MPDDELPDDELPEETLPERSQRAERSARSEGDAAKRGKHRRPPRKKPIWQELLTLFAVALLLTFLIQQFLGRVYSIPSGSMEKTLHGCPGCTADRVLVDKLTYRFTDPSPGDVVVFEGPNSWTEEDGGVPVSGNAVTNALRSVGALVGLAPPNERDFVKRVVAVGGQTVQCCDNRMRVLVDGRPLQEPYVYWDGGKPNTQQHFEPVLVPEGTLWVMGDNRNGSQDSRFQGGGGIRGVVPLDKVIGKARFVVLPPSRWQGVGDHNPQGGIPFALGAPAWQEGLPAGFGLVAAWPMLWLTRRLRWRLRPDPDRR